jgi:phosphoesterase RecJ-like protein
VLTKLIFDFFLRFNDIKDLLPLLSKAESVLITTHTNPDGDAIGSSLAMFHYMKALGKNASVVVPNSYPEFISWLPGDEHVIICENDRKEASRAFSEAQLIICLDFNAIKRSGSLQEMIMNASVPKLMIDHHPDPAIDDFDFLYSTSDTSSTAELIYDFMVEMGHLPLLSADMATCLFVGIMTDTGSFSFACNRPETFSVTAGLLQTGINAEYIHRQVYDTFSEDRLRLLGFSLSEKLIVLDDYATAFISLSKKELKRFNFRVGDTEGIVNYALSIKGIAMAVLLTERKGRIRLSFRSKGSFSVNDLARDHFQGGGHRNAAGGDSFDSLENTISKMMDILPLYREALREAVEA